MRMTVARVARWASFPRRAARRLWRIATHPGGVSGAQDLALQTLWERLPSAVRASRPGLRLGHHIHRRVRARQARACSEYTRFFRNQPLLDHLARIARDWPPDRPLRIAALGCSTGAELYSALWAIRSAAPTLLVGAVGVDISAGLLAIAASARYARDGVEVTDVPEHLVRAMLEPSGPMLEVRRPYRDGVSWLQLDVTDPALVERLGERDLVLANNLFIHMADDVADAALRNAIALLAPGGYLMTYGVDLDVKTRVVRACGLVPDDAGIRAIYEANVRGLARWPLKYIGCEPMDTSRPDWRMRYAAVYRRAPIWAEAVSREARAPTASGPSPAAEAASRRGGGISLPPPG